MSPATYLRQLAAGILAGICAASLAQSDPLSQARSLLDAGKIAESESVLRASNTGTPVTFDAESPAGRAYHDAVARFLGETREMRFVKPERRNFFRVLFGKA